MDTNLADLKGKKILFVASFYPPVTSTNVPGAMRTIKFIRNLHNGTSHVLTTLPAVPESDSALNHLSLPIKNEVIHRVGSWDIFKMLLTIRASLKGLAKRKSSTSATTVETTKSTVFKDGSEVTKPSRLQTFKDFIYNLCYFPDQFGPWILPAYRKGKSVVKEHNIDVIFATGSPWSGLLVGYLIGRATGKPVIIDFRDPWMNNPFHQSKGQLLDNWNARLERRIVENASAVSLNTEPLMEDFLERYPELPKDRFFVMPNGFDLHDFGDLQQNDNSGNPNQVTLCHAGFLYGVRDPAVLLDAIKIANTQLANENLSLRMHQIGNIQLGYDIFERYAEMIADGSLVIEAAKPYKECLISLMESDWVVNVQPATKSQVPSKLYDYLAIQRPILNITPPDGALGKLVSKHEIGELFDFNDKASLAARLVEIAHEHRAGKVFSGYPARNLFNCSEIAKDLAGRIESL